MIMSIMKEEGKKKKQKMDDLEEKEKVGNVGGRPRRKNLK